MIILDHNNRPVKFHVSDFKTPDTSGGDYAVPGNKPALVELRTPGKLKVHLIDSGPNEVFDIDTDITGQPLPYLIDKVFQDAENVADANVRILL